MPLTLFSGSFVLGIRIWAPTKLYALGLKGIVLVVFMWASVKSENLMLEVIECKKTTKAVVI